MNKKEHNGWFNYETWLCNLHFDGFWYEQAQEIFSEADDCGTFTKAENAGFALSDHIKETLEEFRYESLPENNGFFSDLLNAALQEVNTHEIARHYIDELQTEHEAMKERG